MLKQRIITALVLVALLLPALFAATAEPLAGISLVLIAAAAWEWGRLNGLAMRGALRTGVACLLVCLVFWANKLAYQTTSVLWMVTGAVWVLAGAQLMRKGVEGWTHISRGLRLVFGVAALSLTWLAMYQAKVMGTNFLLSILLLVWMADVAAYFSGRAFGRHKLALHISPGKSWEGVWGGMTGVVVLAFAWLYVEQQFDLGSLSLYTRLSARGWGMLVVGVLFLVAMSVVGDLVESLVKRSAGMKDSSQLLPGHGGVLDRVDALLPTFPLALMLLQAV
jgi:phosphatidate cytidylyltransferase